VLVLDPTMIEHTDFRVVRVRVGFCDTMQLPPLQLITYCDPNGFWTRYDISMVVEQGGFTPLPPPPSVQQPLGPSGMGSGERSKGKGKISEMGNGSSSGGSQPPSKQQNSEGGSSGTVMNKVALSSAEIVADKIIPLVQGDQRLVAQSRFTPMGTSSLITSQIASHVVPPTLGAEARVSMKEGGPKDSTGHYDGSPVVTVRPSPLTTPSVGLVSSPLLVDNQHTDVEVTKSGDADKNQDKGLPLIQAQSQAMVLVSPPRIMSDEVSNLKSKVLMGVSLKSLSHTKSGSILMALFPFARFIHDEIVDLFRSFRIQLGKDES
jgi:hypothetical protein